jgi:predicted DNA binding protein
MSEPLSGGQGLTEPVALVVARERGPRSVDGMDLSGRPGALPRAGVGAGAPDANPLVGPDRLALVRMEFPIPDDVWTGSFTREHPEVILQLYSLATGADGKLIGDYEVVGPGRDWQAEIARQPNVVEARCLDLKAPPSRYRVVFASTTLINLTGRLRVVVRFPVTARAGRVSFEVVDRLSRIRALVAGLRERGIAPRVTSLTQDSSVTGQVTFTAVQQETFRRAFAAGYFDVPRRITLTELAAQLGRSKSSVSVTLALVERKLAQAAIHSARSLPPEA